MDFQISAYCLITEMLIIFEFETKNFLQIKLYFLFEFSFRNFYKTDFVKNFETFHVYSHRSVSTNCSTSENREKHRDVSSRWTTIAVSTKWTLCGERLWLAIANERVKRRPTRNSADSLVTWCSSLMIPRCDYETAVELINESKVSTFQHNRNIVAIQNLFSQ